MQETGMSRAAKSVFIFAIYAVVLGITLVIVPNLLLGLFGVPPTSEVWIRVAGMLLIFIGVYYIWAARSEMTEFMRLTVYLRSSVVVFFIAYVALGFAPPTLILFGVVDLVAAMWTLWALRAPTPIVAGMPRS